MMQRWVQPLAEQQGFFDLGEVWEYVWWPAVYF